MLVLPTSDAREKSPAEKPSLRQNDYNSLSDEFSWSIIHREYQFGRLEYEVLSILWLHDFRGRKFLYEVDVYSEMEVRTELIP